MAALRSGRGGGPTTSRSRHHAITADALGALWPTLDHALRDELRQAGLSRDLVDEVLQEVAVHALAERAPQDEAALIAWARPLAASLAANQLDRPTSLDLAALVDRPGPHDVPHEASRRLALEAVLHALAEMSQADRAAVLAGLDYGSQPSLAEARTVAVRRFRARQVLARIAQSFGLVAFWRLTRRTWPRLAVPTATVATAAAVVVALAPAEQPVSVASPPRVVLLPEAQPAVALDAARPRHVATATAVRAPAATPAPRPDRPADPLASPATTGTVIDGPGGTRVVHREVEQRPDDRLACVYSTLIRRICTPELRPPPRRDIAR